jgi:uncharacterized protein (DUF427 family)
MFQAVWHGAVLAESDQTVKVEGNHYFPPDSLRREHFTPSKMTSVCPWKGTAADHRSRGLLERRQGRARP